MTGDAAASRRVRVDYEPEIGSASRSVNTPSPSISRQPTVARTRLPLRPSSSLPAWPRAWPFTPAASPARHDIPTEGLAVTAEFSMASHPARWARSRFSCMSRGALGRAAASLLAVTSHCTVHSTLTHAPEVRIELAALTPGPCEQAGAARRGV